MLKSFILLAVFLNAYLAQDYFDWATIQENDKVNCILKPSKMFSCRGPEGIIECMSSPSKDAISNTKSLGIAKCSNHSNSTNLIVDYCFYVKEIVNFDNETLRAEEGYSNVSSMSIYYDSMSKNNESIEGIRIDDLKCYNRLVDYLEESRSGFMNSTMMRPTAAKNETVFASVDMVRYVYGDFLFVDVAPEKRHNHKSFFRRSAMLRAPRKASVQQRMNADAGKFDLLTNPQKPSKVL
jgi:hypothetical protein